MTSLLFDRLGVRTGALCLALALATGSSLACTDDGGEEVGDGDGDGDGDMSETMGDGDGDGDAGDGDGDVALSYAADIQPIWDASCTASCHEPGGTAVSSVDLSGDSYDNVVGAPSGQAPGLSIVEAGSTVDSYLVAKLRGTQIEAGGLGGQMPSGADPLPEATISMIEEWIDTGAAP